MSGILMSSSVQQLGMFCAAGILFFSSSQKPGWFEPVLHSWGVWAEDVLFALHSTSSSEKAFALGKLGGWEGAGQEGCVGNRVPGRGAPQEPFCS